jgi:tetratricopeptide (TPR) repeat protein
MQRVISAVLLTLALGASRAPVRADGPQPPPTPDEAAAAVVKAWEAKDEAQVQALAARDEPDPWLVADAMLVQGAREAAEAFAKAAPRKDVELLPEFVTTWRNAEADKRARTALAKGNAARVADRDAEALEHFSAAPAEALPFLRVRCAYGVGLALGGLRRSAEAADKLCAVATECEAIGWLARAAIVLRDCIREDRAAERLPKAFETAERLLALETSRGSRLGLATAHETTGWLHGEAGQWDEAHAARTRALEIFRELGDPRRIAAALNEIAWTAHSRRDLADINAALKASLAVSEPAGLWPEVARSYEIMATTLQDVGKVSGAAERFRQAAEAAEKVPDDVLAARMRYRIGRALGDVGAYERALEALGASLDAWEAMGPQRANAAVVARARMAWTLAAMGRLEEARKEVDRVVAFAKSSRVMLVQGLAGCAQARLLSAEGKVTEAVTAYRAAIPQLESASEMTLSRLVLLEIAEAYRAAKDPAQAATAATAALEAATESTDRFVLHRAQAVLARIRQDQGEPKEALELAKQAREGHQALADVRAMKDMDVLLLELEAAAAAPR